MDLLPPLLGDTLEVQVRWSQSKKQFVAR
jgi:hypothetical protein